MAVRKDDKFFNTTGEDAEYVKKRVEKCVTQEERVLEIFRKQNRALTASQVWEIFGTIGTPLTSIRRAMTRLKTAGILDKTNLKRNGLYNQPENYFKMHEVATNKKQSKK